jgi:hypothetical protein
MKLTSRAVGALGLAALLSACQIIFGLGHELEVAPPTDAGVPEHCAFGAAPPPRPAAQDGPSLPTLFFSMTSQNGTGTGALVGVDIDGVCTCDSRDRSVHGGLASCKAPSGNGCDDDGGVDDALALLRETLAPLGTFLVGDVGRQSECGRLSLIVAVAGYNGLANDPDVQVSIFPSSGIWDPHSNGEVDASADCPLDGGAGPGPFPARHDGTDAWSAGASDIADHDAKSYLQTRGYVTDQHLVVDARFSDDVVQSVFSSSLVTILSPSLTARIVPLDGGGPPFALADAALTGRVATEQVLTAIGNSVLGPGLGLACNDSRYLSVQRKACEIQDLVLPPASDFKGAGCNALSFVLQFQAEPAQIGSVREVALQVDGSCPPATTSCP